MTPECATQCATKIGNAVCSCVGFSPQQLIDVVTQATQDCKNKLAIIQNKKKDEISIADMFDMQMLMNHLAQLSAMLTAVVAASNSAIQNMARNVKG